LNSKRKFFLRTTKNRPTDPSKICALEFKREFRRFGICSVSATIDDDRSIFFKLLEHAVGIRHWEKTVSPCDHKFERWTQEAVSDLAVPLAYLVGPYG